MNKLPKIHPVQEGVEAFKIEALINGEWKFLTQGDKMTFNFKAPVDDVTVQRYR